MGPKYESNFISVVFNVVLSSFTPESRRVAVLFRSGSDCKVINITSDHVGNLLILGLEVLFSKTLVLVILYSPNKDQPEFYLIVRDYFIEKYHLLW